MAESETGALVFKRFYGPLAQVRLFIYILIILLPAVDIYLVWSYYTNRIDPIEKFFSYIMLVLSVLAPLIIGLAYLHGKIKYPKFPTLLWSGEFEWDLYENGIMIKVYSPTAQNHIDSSFIPFSGISRVISSPQRHQIEEVFELYKTLVCEKYPERSMENAKLSPGMSMVISSRVWFIDMNGKLLDLTMQRYFIKPSAIPKFRKLLHEKVKVVE
jgi:hypothetical protein